MKYILIICLAILNSCTDPHYKTKPHIEAAHKVSYPYIYKAKKDHDLQILGTGGAMMNDVDYISISFIARGSYCVEEGRKHFISVVKPFIESVDNSKELKKYLKDPKHPVNAAEISITYKDSNGNYNSKEYLSHIFIYRGEIVYSIKDQGRTMYREIHRETYQEALEKVLIK